MSGTVERARDLLEQCAKVRTGYGDDAVVIVDAAEVAAMAGAVIELYALRGLLAGLPDDDWQPIDYAVIELAQEEARGVLAGES